MLIKFLLTQYIQWLPKKSWLYEWDELKSYWDRIFLFLIFEFKSSVMTYALLCKLQNKMMSTHLDSSLDI